MLFPRRCYGECPHDRINVQSSGWYSGTPILDQMRVEWNEMATAASGVPADEVTVKEETPAGCPIELIDTTSAVVATEARPDRTILSGIYNITSERLDRRYKRIPHDPFQLTLFVDEETDIWWGKLQRMKFECFMKIDPGPSYGSDDLWTEYSLGFRIHNTDYGDLQFSKPCKGKIRFDEASKTLEGTLFDVPWDLGDEDFKGRRLSGPKRPDELGSEWNRIVTETFSRQRKNISMRQRIPSIGS